jgi:sugar lactone lactonase YvrE
MTVFECVLDAKAALGECPMWHAGEQRLYWIDGERDELHRFDPATGHDESRKLADHIGSFGFRDGGGLVAALGSGFGYVDFETARIEPIAAVEADNPLTTFNDGRAAPGGRFFAGTMGVPVDPRYTRGAFYRLDPDGSVTQICDAMGTSNGLAFSPDGRLLNHADSLPSVQTIWVWDHDPATGDVDNRRIFATTHDLRGRPDGAAVDAEGCYWSANVDGWQVVRYAPDGSIERTIPVPVQKPSMPCFGGPDLDILYVTSICEGGFAAMEPDQPLAGGLFACQPGVKGLPEPKFRG